MKLLIAVGMLVAGQVSAQVYRCENNGRVEYSESPCASGGRQVDTRPSSEGVTGLKRDAALAAAKESQQAAAPVKKEPKPSPKVTCTSSSHGIYVRYPKCS